MIGQTISHYKITEKLGEGGMGEVYLAEDTSLKRKVALKFLPDYLQQDEVAQKRFLREAQSAAALDHPFICHIHEIGEVEGKSFIAMEYVKGQTLKEKLLEGPVPLKQTLQIGMEIAEALEEAHKAGIAHRDLKPANIMLTSGCHVKVMDFGLAKKVVDEDGTEQDITSALTREGTTLGTLPYMSPEQLRGKTVDTRTDIFSFGIILYELLSGVHPFRKAKQAETTGAILHEEPSPLSRYTEDTSEVLQHTIIKMLEKAPNDRYQSVHEVGTNLKRLSERLSLPKASSVLLKSAVPVPWTRRLRYWAAGAAILTILAMALFSLLSPIQMPKVTSRPYPVTQDGVVKNAWQIATDGRVIYYSTRLPDGVLHFVPVEGGDSVKIDPWPDQDRISRVLDISPDMSRLLVGSRRRDEGPYSARLWTISLPSYTTEPVGDFTVGHLNVLTASWSPDARQIAFTKGEEGLTEGNNGLYVVDSLGGEPKKLLSVPEPAYPLWPVWSRDGSRLRYTAFSHGEGPFAELWEIGIDRPHESYQLVNGFTDPPIQRMARWTPDGAYTVFLSGYAPQDSDLWVFPEDTGFFGSSAVEPEPLTSGLQIIAFTFSPDGKKIFAFRGDPRGELFSYGIALGHWVRYEFEPETSASYVDFSSDGQWVTYVKYPEMTLWYCRRDGTRKRQIKVEARRASWPRWSPDSKHIAYSVTNAVITRLDKRVYLVSIEGGAPRRVLEEDYNQYSHCWSPDGTKLLISGLPEDRHPIKVVNIRTGEVTELPASLGLASPECSPDGQYIAALKREKLDDSQLVLFDRSSQLWSGLDSCDYFGFSQWSADGRYLYYRKENTFYQIRIRDRKIEELATPRPIQTHVWEPWWRFDPDGNLLILRNLSKTEICALDIEAH